jgi:hypothetical protein
MALRKAPMDLSHPHFERFDKPAHRWLVPAEAKARPAWRRPPFLVRADGVKEVAAVSARYSPP